MGQISCKRYYTIIRDRADLIKEVMDTVQDEEEDRWENVYIQRMTDMEVTSDGGKWLWKNSKITHSTTDWDFEYRYYWLAVGMECL